MLQKAQSSNGIGEPTGAEGFEKTNNSLGRVRKEFENWKLIVLHIV